MRLLLATKQRVCGESDITNVRKFIFLRILCQGSRATPNSRIISMNKNMKGGIRIAIFVDSAINLLAII